MLRSRLPNVLRDLEKFGHLSREEMSRHQATELRALVELHHRRNPTYRRLCEEKGVRPEDIRSLDDLERLPIIERDFLSKFGFHCGEGGALSVSLPELGTFLNSSGSTGKPKKIPIAESAIGSIFETSAMGMWIGGVRGHEEPGGGPILPIFPHGPFPGSFFIQNASEIIGLSAKSDMGLPYDWHLRTAQELRAKYMVTSPSFLSAFANFAASRIDLRSLGLSRILLGGEFFSEGFRESMESRFGCKVRDIYGCGETQVVAVESDCVHAEHRGFLYHLAHQSIIEIVRPGTSDRVAPGEPGEMIITVLNRKAWPVIRYRMGDVISLHPEINPAAAREYSFPLVSRIQGRADDMLIYGNVNIYPELIFNALTAYARSPSCPLPLSQDKFQFELVQDSAFSTTALLRIETNEADRPAPSAEQAALVERRLVAALMDESDELRHAITVGKQVPAPKIDVVAAGSLYVKEQKLRRMLDKRPRSLIEAAP